MFFVSLFDHCFVKVRLCLAKYEQHPLHQSSIICPKITTHYEVVDHHLTPNISNHIANYQEPMKLNSYKQRSEDATEPEGKMTNNSKITVAETLPLLL